MKATIIQSSMHFSWYVCLSLLSLILLASCSESSEPSMVNSNDTGKKVSAFQNSNAIANANSNSNSYAGDYNIALTVNGLIWTYTITKNSGAKNLSHFILNFQNCGSSSATINNIVWATVNGAPAVLKNSEGNTGCNVSGVTQNFVKFDDLPSATSYTIVFQTDKPFGNFVGTTAWLKAGTSCIAYPVLAPCCPL